MSIRRHTIYNFLGGIVPLALSIITIPIYLGLIGEARYGVLAIAWLLLGYFGLFDLGLGRATARRIAALHQGTEAERAQTFWTALTLNVGLGIVGGLLIWPIAAYFFGNVFKIDDALRSEVRAAVPWLVLAVPMATLSGVLTGALQGRQRFLDLNLISVSGTALFQLFPLIMAMLWKPELGILLPAALFARLLTLFALFARCRRHIYGGHSATFLRAEAGQLLSFGAWVTVTSFVGPMMVILDRFIIGALFGASAVTYYTVPFQLAQRSTMIASALTSALFPRFASASPEEEQRLAHEALRALLVIMTPLVSVGILFYEPFVTWWITPAFAQQSSPLGQIILAGFWINGFAMIPYAQLQARGRPDIVAKCHLGEVLPYFGLLYVGLTIFGVAGVAAAFSLRALADFGLLAGFAGTLVRSLRMLLFPAVLLLIALLVPNLLSTGRPEWFLFIILHLLITFGWAWEKHRSKSSRSHRQYPEEFLHGDLNATANEKEPWMQPWAAEGMEAVARCPICETAERKIMHADLTDNVFRAAPGKWSLWQCKNCRSAYLDPRPTPNTIHKAYTNYYTHQHGAGRDHYAALHPLRKLRRRLVNGYTNWRFGTRAEPADMLGVLVAFALPSFKKVLDRQYRHLPKLPKSGGVLLDLGCGNGSYLSLAHSCGWQAVGLDPDPEVVANATRQGLTVHQGGIEYFEGQRELFDVITLDHVIEHVHDPIKVLKECHTLLKPGGQLWVETPNIDSFSHARFKKNWRGLETPRHLVLFTRKALHQALISIGFSKPRDVSRPSPVVRMYEASHAMEKGYSPYQELVLPKMLRRQAMKAIFLEKLFPTRREFLSVSARKGKT